MIIDNFTLMIPVRNRHYNLPKIFKYYEDLECEKIIADSSLEKYKNDIPSSFTYLYYGTKYVYEKYYDVVKKINSKYFLYCPDDDIVLKSSIQTCINFLNNNQTYSSCDGEYFELLNDVVPKYPESICNCINGNFENSSYIERLKFFFKINVNEKNYYPRVHSVVKTELVKIIYKNIVQNKNEWAIGFTDLFFTFILSIMGNLKTLPILYQIKKVGDRLIEKLYIKNEMNVNELLINNVNDQNIDNKLKIFAEILSIKESISLEKALEIVKDLFVNFRIGIDSRQNIEKKNIKYKFSITDEKYKNEITLIKKLILE